MSPKNGPIEANRRQFLKSTVLGVGAATVGASPMANVKGETPALPVKNPFSEDPVAIRKLTDSINCSRVGFGTGMHGFNHESELTRLGEETAIELLRYAYDRGIRLFDMADMYGTHDVVGKALRDKPRESFTLVSKIWAHKGNDPDENRPSITENVKRFLDEIGTDYLDVLQLHCMMRPNWPEDFAREMDELEKVKEEGLIRAHGVSCHSFEASQIAAEHPWVDVIHLRLNPFGSHMEGSVEENMEVARTAQANGKGIIVMKVFGEGSITDPAEQQQSIDFLTHFDAVDAFVVALASHEHVDLLLEKTAIALKKEEV